MGSSKGLLKRCQLLLGGALALLAVAAPSGEQAMAANLAGPPPPTTHVSQAQNYTLPGGLGTLTSNVWRATGDGTISGNTRQWNWQVSAYYSGSNTVQSIKTEWKSSASLRNGASISMGVGADSVSVGWSSSWQTATTNPKYWENTNGATNSSWSSNIAIGPSGDYLSGSITTYNTGTVKLTVDPRPFYITASV